MRYILLNDWVKVSMSVKISGTGGSIKLSGTGGGIKIGSPMSGGGSGWQTAYSVDYTAISPQSIGTINNFPGSATVDGKTWTVFTSNAGLFDNLEVNHTYGLQADIFSSYGGDYLQMAIPWTDIAPGADLSTKEVIVMVRFKGPYNYTGGGGGSGDQNNIYAALNFKAISTSDYNIDGPYLVHGQIRTNASHKDTVGNNGISGGDASQFDPPSDDVLMAFHLNNAAGSYDTAFYDDAWPGSFPADVSTLTQRYSQTLSTVSSSTQHLRLGWSTYHGGHLWSIAGLKIQYK
jgi:hypothetical protein